MPNEPDAPTPPAEPTPPPAPPAQEVDWKAEARKWEQRSKENKAKADRLDELEAAQQSAEERLTGQLTEATRAREAAERRALQYEVGISKGINPALIPRLAGATRDEMEADAEQLLAAVTPPTPTPGPVTTPTAVPPRGGLDPETDPEETDPRKLAARLTPRY